MPEAVITSIKKNKVALKAPITTPVGTGFRSINVHLRQRFDLFASIRPCKIYPGVKTRYDNVDIVIFRENTEDLYAGIEFAEGKPETLQLIENIQQLSQKNIRPDSAISIKPISITNSERIFKAAFEYAIKHNRKQVTAVTKANIMKYTDGLFLEVGRRVAKEYPNITFSEALIDNLCMQLVKNPERFDILVCPNLYGDIVSDLCAGLIGGLGVAPGANIGKEYAIFEAVHGSAPKYKGMNKVNPTALLLSGVMMLRHLGEQEAADRLEQAIAAVIKEGTQVTYDLSDNPVGTSQMADAIIKKL